MLSWRYILKCSYEELKRLEIPFKPVNCENLRPSNVVNGIKLLFPISTPQGTKIQAAWALKCVCGEVFAANVHQVKRCVTKSCGCLSGRKYRYRRNLKAYLLAKSNNLTIFELPSDCKSRDMKVSCDICGFLIEDGNYSEHLNNNAKFCKCTKNFKRNTKDAVDGDCKDYSLTSTWSILKFPTEFTNKKSYRITLQCKVCNHVTDMSYNNFTRGKGCKSCRDRRTTESLQKDISYFIEKSVLKHGHRYDYSKVIYKKCREHVEIICKEHGSFWQSPDNHYNKGKGCPECKKLKLKNISLHVNKVKENKEIYSNLPSELYLLEVGDYLKIGISSVLDKRVKDIRRDSKLPVKVLYSKRMNLFEAFCREYTLLKLFGNFVQKDVKFQGHTECIENCEDVKNEIMFCIEHMESLIEKS